MQLFVCVVALLKFSCLFMKTEAGNCSYKQDLNVLTLEEKCKQKETWKLIL